MNYDNSVAYENGTDIVRLAYGYDGDNGNINFTLPMFTKAVRCIAGRLID